MSRWCPQYLLQRAALLALMCLVITSSVAYAYKFGDFPGVGSEQVWTQANVRFNEGLRFAKRGQFDLAIQKFRNAISVYPNEPSYYYNLALCYEKRNKSGDLQLAEKEYKRSIELAPNVWESWNGLATPLYLLGKYHESREAKVKALKLGPPAADIPAIKDDIEKVASKIRSITSGR